MAQIEFSIGGKDFKPLIGHDSSGPYALTDVAESGIYDNTRYHPKGCTSSLVNHGGLIGYKLRMKGRYVGDNPYQEAVADSLSWEDPLTLDIVDQNGKTYHRCKLDPGGMKPFREGAHAKADGSIDMFVDVEMTFTCDGGQS